MYGVKMTSIILRSDNVWLKILLGKKFIFTSTASWKEPTDVDEKTKRRQQQIERQKTDLALFGPIIKEKKTRKKKEINTPDPIKVDNTINSEELLPINLWNLPKEQFKITKAPYSKKHLMPTDNTISSEGTEHSSSIKDSKETSNKVPPKRKPLAEKKVNNEITFSENIEPSTPFFKKDEIILPFPMVLKKECTLPSSKEILSIASAKVDVPSVTQVLSKTMSDKSEMMLAMWRKRKIAEVGEEGLKEFMRESKLTGKELHLNIETYLRGVEYNSVKVEPRISGHWLSMKSILGSLEDVAVLESYVVHKQLKYKGFVDCVCKYKDNLVVVEWKTSQRTKSTLQDAYDDPIQIAAYIGAINADERYPLRVENALLVVAYPTGRPANVLTLDKKLCEHYWNEWLKRLEAFNELKKSAEKQ
ncbi:mitochondrial genome maintenance exonuclease 1-like isoform X1 [Daphnia pulex]|uniref:mitochondrial genome maintenance exonuclease 1-like isoform X1 n=1 Tax=Daphnia pulex TaxID=6669 RepID=UPI001EDF5350|nr:mitochondrial genome maintenance exonuclease 1-like isoform X1 [Daphnia pulex]